MENKNICAVDGCSTETAWKSGEYCKKHYARLVRHGDPNGKKKIAQQGVDSQGYSWIVVGLDHPLRDKPANRIRLHRHVLYEKIGPGEHPCHWCGSMLKWKNGMGLGAIFVDHVDGVKGNNTPENLVPSCTACNTQRSSFMRWVEKHMTDPFLIQIMRRVGTIKGLSPRSFPIEEAVETDDVFP
jgi:hypothetical protein